MNVGTDGIAMFLHVSLVVLGMMLGGVMHTALIQLRRSSSSSDMRPWTSVIHRVEPVLPIVALAVLATGAWLIDLSDGEFSWGQGWVLASLIGLVIAETVGASLAPRSAQLRAAITAAPDGPVSAELRDRVLDPALWFGSHFVTATFFGIIFLMTAQPTGAWGPITILVIAAAIGLVTAVPFVHEAATTDHSSRHVHQHH